MSDTQWNGESCEARRCVVVVGTAERQTLWYAELAGKKRLAVEIKQNDKTFYIDNQHGDGWYKVTHGGGPELAHGSLAIERVEPQ